jgi:CDP-diacylglycerol--serine O-phosphatidyltransferase
VSFGATPAVVMYFWCLHSLGTFGVAISFFYMLAVAMRLAKFDTQDTSGFSEEKILESKKYFYGMPCPAGAVTLSGLILMGVWLFGDGISVTEYCLYMQTLVTALTAIYISLMMVGDIKFRSFKDSDGEGHVSKLYIIGLLLILVMLVTMPEKLLYFIMIGYALSGPISHYQHIKSERKEK